MKKYFGALLLLPLVLMVMAQFAAAQDTMSAVLSTPYNSRPGSQVIYFLTESEFKDGAFQVIKNGDAYKSYMTITNTSTDTSVLVHYQFYDAISCNEVFDFVDVLTPQDTNLINPQDLRVITGEYRGVISGGRYLMTATAVDATRGQGVDTRAISFNYLIGQMFITNINTGTAWGGNAITRMAVNYYGASLDAGSCFTTPKDFPSFTGRFAIGDATAVYTPATPPYNAVYSYVGCNTALGGVVPGFLVSGNDEYRNGGHVVVTAKSKDTIRLLQNFKPATLIVPNFFAPGNVDATKRGTSVQFGNRLTMVSFADSYNATDGYQFKLGTADSSISSWFIDNYEQPFSLPAKTLNCVDEFVLSPREPNNKYAGTDTIGGIGADLIGASIYAAVDQGGFVRMNVTKSAANILFGWFSQSLSNSGLYAGVGDLLVGLGRLNVAVTVGSTTVNLPATEAAYIVPVAGGEPSTATLEATALAASPFIVEAAKITP